MEVHNLNENEYIVLPVGYRIAQIVFSATGPVATEYAKASGNYQADVSADLAVVKAAWRPWMLLPRAYASPVKLPQPVSGLSEGLL